MKTKFRTEITEVTFDNDYFSGEPMIKCIEKIYKNDKYLTLEYKTIQEEDIPEIYEQGRKLLKMVQEFYKGE